MDLYKSLGVKVFNLLLNVRLAQSGVGVDLELIGSIESRTAKRTLFGQQRDYGVVVVVDQAAYFQLTTVHRDGVIDLSGLAFAVNVRE